MTDYTEEALREAIELYHAERLKLVTEFQLDWINYCGELFPDWANEWGEPVRCDLPKGHPYGHVYTIERVVYEQGRTIHQRYPAERVRSEEWRPGYEWNGGKRRETPLEQALRIAPAPSEPTEKEKD